MPIRKKEFETDVWKEWSSVLSVHAGERTLSFVGKAGDFKIKGGSLSQENKKKKVGARALATKENVVKRRHEHDETHGEGRDI